MLGLPQYRGMAACTLLMMHPISCYTTSGMAAVSATILALCSSGTI